MIIGTLEDLYKKFPVAFQASVYPNMITECLAVGYDENTEFYPVYKDYKKAENELFQRHVDVSENKIDNQSDIYKFYLDNKIKIDKFISGESKFFVYSPLLSPYTGLSPVSFLFGKKKRDNARENIKRMVKYQEPKEFEDPEFVKLKFDTGEVFHIPEKGDSLWFAHTDFRSSLDEVVVDNDNILITQNSFSSSMLNNVRIRKDLVESSKYSLNKFTLDSELGCYDNNVINRKIFLTKKEAVAFIQKNIDEQQEYLDNI